ncbi:hypothetical protein Ga0100231_024720 [Opitutaceae bacterium TAV4]|nr:hypothetical protein Ga0100231_024720 [Opitutaceae bacterium TAV4]RRK00924.1 hypothetical protein Ga0100230_024445 [Opitutaceae bacterium TAV3]
MACKARWLALLVAAFPGHALPAITNPVDYFTDDTLARITVNVASIKTKPATLPEIFSLVEQQTGFKFVYLATQLPLDTTLALESRETVTLARLFTDVSSMVGVVFIRHNRKIVVRVQWPEDRIAIPGPNRTGSIASATGAKS